MGILYYYAQYTDNVEIISIEKNQLSELQVRVLFYFKYLTLKKSH